MHDWYPKRLAPRNGTPVILWIEDEEAPPTYPVTVGRLGNRRHDRQEPLARLWRALRHPHLF